MRQDSRDFLKNYCLSDLGFTIYDLRFVPGLPIQVPPVSPSLIPFILFILANFGVHPVPHLT